MYSTICEIAESPLSVVGLIGGCAPLSIGVSSMKDNCDIPRGALGFFIGGDCLKPIDLKVDVISLANVPALIRPPRLESVCKRPYVKAERPLVNGVSADATSFSVHADINNPFRTGSLVSSEGTFRITSLLMPACPKPSIFRVADPKALNPPGGSVC